MRRSILENEQVSALVVVRAVTWQMEEGTMPAEADSELVAPEEPCTEDVTG